MRLQFLRYLTLFSFFQKKTVFIATPRYCSIKIGTNFIHVEHTKELESYRTYTTYSIIVQFQTENAFVLFAHGISIVVLSEVVY